MTRGHRLSLLGLSAGLVLAGITGVPSPAWATCLLQCKAALHFNDCTTPEPADTWPLGTQLSFTCSCEECCSPPGGPETCSPAQVDPTLLKVLDGSFETVPGTITAMSTTCDSTAMFSFDGTLKEGTSYLSDEYIVIMSFYVADAGMGAGGSGGGGSSSGGAGGSGDAGGSGGGNDAGGSGGDEAFYVGGCSCSLHKGGSAADWAAWLAAGLAVAGASRRRASRKSS
jgi:hypothetical protein